jgi:hypothetical protein
MNDTTMQHRGVNPGRVRRAASACRVVATRLPMPTAWRARTNAPAFHGGATAFSVTTGAYFGITNPAGAEGLMTAKRPARHLRTRST